MMCRVTFLVNSSSSAPVSLATRLLLLAVIFLPRPGQAIDLIDQPKIFASPYEWNRNLFKRIADCIRDTEPAASDTWYRRQIKNYAIPLCNDMLRTINNNWAATGTPQGSATSPTFTPDAPRAIATLVDTEYQWCRVAYAVYGLITRSQMCGLNGQLVNCNYVLDSDLNAIKGITSPTATMSQTIAMDLSGEMAVQSPKVRPIYQNEIDDVDSDTGSYGESNEAR